MHVHLDPVGGIAGDMFAAAMLDAWPALESELRDALERAGLTAIVSVAREPHDDGVLTGSRFRVTPTQAEQHGHHHRHYREVVELLHGADLPAGVRARALAMFRLLGEAEAKVHGSTLEQVSFHEVGAWDSIADVVSAAWLLDRVGVQSWSCAPLPMGGGRVHTAHGELAIPAPATTVLLQGFPLHDDGRPGERVTPTGAAILRHLEPDFAPRRAPMRLVGSGSGFGTRRLQGMSNVLRVLVFEVDAAGLRLERIAQCSFEVDDQTAEDLAVGLDRLRAMDAVLDVVQAPVHGKKGRVAMQVQVLARADAVDRVLAACLDETSTLGVRWQIVERTSLARSIDEVDAGGSRVRVKQVTRPDGRVTRKAEISDLAAAGGSRAAREDLRRAAEAMPRDARDGAVRVDKERERDE